MIASKVVCDDTYSNKSWCVVGQAMFSLKEVNQMEREMCGYLEWQLNVPPDELDVFRKKLESDFSRSPATHRAAPPTLTIDTSATVVSSNRSAQGTGLQTPPMSPADRLPLTPEASHSATPSPASSDGSVSTPPSASSGSDRASIVSSATSPDSHFPRGARAAISPAKTAGEFGFARAEPSMW